MADGKNIRNKIKVGIISGVIVAILGYFGRHLWPPVWCLLAVVFFSFWSWLLAAHQVWGWVLLILCVATFIFALRLIAALRRPAPPDFRQYNEGSFFGLVWRWNYFGGDVQRPIIPYCPRCDIQILPQEDMDYGPWGRRPFTIYSCDHCDGTNLKLEEALQETEGKIIRQIHRDLRTGRWRAAIHDEPHEA